MEGCCFYILFTGVDPVRVLGHGHGPVLGVVVLVDLGWTFGWTCGAQKLGRPPLSSYTVVTVLVCVMLRIRLPEHVVEHLHSTNTTVALIPAVDRRHHHRRHRPPTGEGTNRGTEGRARGDVVVVVWRRWWGVQWGSSPSRWWSWSLPRRCGGRWRGAGERWWSWRW